MAFTDTLDCYTAAVNTSVCFDTKVILFLENVYELISLSISEKHMSNG